jgi:hypothetical protein
MSDKGGDKDARAERLAAQLRVNLKRRKEQARGTAEPPARPGDVADS